MRKNREWWQQELDYINSVSCDNPGKEFCRRPAIFADYCWMQAKCAREDGFDDIAEAIDKRARAARECA